MKSVIELRAINKRYTMGEDDILALREIDLVVDKGEFLAVMGTSGSGKSTLMNIIGLLDHPDSGEYLLNGVEVSKLDDDARSAVRNRTIGFIFQSFNLLAQSTALRNVLLPLTYRSLTDTSRHEKAEEALITVGLRNRMEHRPTQMSGGERQRVAIARALVGDPTIILADEPTGNLDTKTGLEILQLLSALTKRGQTVILVTHDPDMAAFADRTIHMRDGWIVQ